MVLPEGFAADGKLKVDFKANNTGSFRRDVVVMRSENFVDSIYDSSTETLILSLNEKEI